jgi:hypothetical protein
MRDRKVDRFEAIIADPPRRIKRRLNRVEQAELSGAVELEINETRYDINGEVRATEIYPASYDRAQDATRTERIFNFVTGTVAEGKKSTDVSWALDWMTDWTLTGIASNKIFVRRIVISTERRRKWRVVLWSRTGLFSGTVYFNDRTRVGDRFLYDSGELDIPYEDLSGRYEIHATVIDRSLLRSLLSKSENATMTITYEPAG